MLFVNVKQPRRLFGYNRPLGVICLKIWVNGFTYITLCRLSATLLIGSHWCALTTRCGPLGFAVSDLAHVICALRTHRGLSHIKIRFPSGCVDGGSGHDVEG